MFVWRYLAESEKRAGESEAFEDREAAESWLSQEWASLRERGIAEVVLFDDELGQSVYRMSLGPGTD